MNEYKVQVVPVNRVGRSPQTGKIDLRMRDLKPLQQRLHTRVRQRMVVELGSNIALHGLAPGRAEAAQRVVPLERLRKQVTDDVLEPTLDAVDEKSRGD